MNLTLERLASDGESSVGALFRDGVFYGFTLEDEHRAFKKFGETRIPAGTYEIKLRTAGRLHKKYSRFDEHRGMLWLQNVPEFTWIYIHIGNFDEDTAGCILVGDGCMSRPGVMSLQASTHAYRRLYKAVVDAAEAGDLTITIIDRDIQ